MDSSKIDSSKMNRSNMDSSKMDSDQSHFNVSLIVTDEVTGLQERGEPKRNRTAVLHLLLTSLASYLLAKQAHWLRLKRITALSTKLIKKNKYKTTTTTTTTKQNIKIIIKKHVQLPRVTALMRPEAKRSTPHFSRIEKLTRQSFFLEKLASQSFFLVKTGRLSRTEAHMT